MHGRKEEIYNELDTRAGWTKENGLCMEYFWGMGYITVVLFAILQNGAFQHDFIDFFMTPFMWYVRFCKWLVYPTYGNGFNQKIAYTGGEVWVIRILAIIAVLFIMVIIMETKKVERNFTNIFDWKPFRDSSAWRCNQRVSTCEFDPVICVCQYGNRVAQSVPGVPDMQLNPCY